MTHDYKGDGTTTLFAVMSTLDGAISLVVRSVTAVSRGSPSCAKSK